MRDLKKRSFIALTFLIICGCNLFAAERPVPTDSRIKTLVYSKNEIFRIVLNYGYQTTLEFQKDERVETISVGDSYAWQLSPFGNMLFIKPLETTVMTNMTIITNKRTYQFELESRSLGDAYDAQLAYVVRFFYTDESEDTPSLSKFLEGNLVFEDTPNNFNYSIRGPKELVPSIVFDDGVRTFFHFNDDLKIAPVFFAADLYKNGSSKLISRKMNKYFMVNTISKMFTIQIGKETISVINNEFRKKDNDKRKR
ncbi:Type IV secretion system protein VirB9 [Candidatus Cyrtobacter comes]|uniref:Type IV secretion system protein VirB9 n=1 Tax=Candidatus Cyrtobacter comes TaxID=675776 RepID=A0ABU5L8Y7_9RICK|nr:TrbG/VirB9 family P-type conjugative transfer protein [Candidatus Cyrtobacter comes]MDZ5762502.1 Type IV secretion system protein VirB9 [Candidatus Cyrtobacter comes]